MIKKRLLMSAGIVLGSMITTASFAWPASEDCVDARSVHHNLMIRVRLCRDEFMCGVDFNLRELRKCKNLSMTVVRAVCPHSSYINEELGNWEEKEDCNVKRWCIWVCDGLEGKEPSFLSGEECDEYVKENEMEPGYWCQPECHGEHLGADGEVDAVY